MNTKSVHVPWVAAPLVMVLLLVISVAPVHAGDPVPGLDITIEQIPGGKILTVKTDKKGKYIFDRLAPGTYKLRVGPPKPAAKSADYNSSRSNTSTSINTQGIEVHTVNIELSSKMLQGKDPGITIKIGNQGPGQISGQVTTAVEKIKAGPSKRQMSGRIKGDNGQKSNKPLEFKE